MLEDVFPVLSHCLLLSSSLPPVEEQSSPPSSDCLPCAGPPGRGNGVRTGMGLSPVQTLLRLVTGEGAGDWVGDVTGLLPICALACEREEHISHYPLYAPMASNSQLWKQSGLISTAQVRRCSQLPSCSLISLCYYVLFLLPVLGIKPRASCM